MPKIEATRHAQSKDPLLACRSCLSRHREFSRIVGKTESPSKRKIGRDLESHPFKHEGQGSRPLDGSMRVMAWLQQLLRDHKLRVAVERS
jgi:hypothetical protein